MSAIGAADVPGTPGDPFAGRLAGDLGALDEFARAFGGAAGSDGSDATAAGLLPRRINADRETVEQDLAKLVLGLVDLVRRLLERQALRRVDAGALSDAEVERMGETFLALDQRRTELCSVFGVQRAELELRLGAIHDLQ